MKIFLSFILIAISIFAGATHNRGGEITYIHISGNTYQFTISTCTKSSVAADRQELEINFVIITCQKKSKGGIYFRILHNAILPPFSPPVFK